MKNYFWEALPFFRLLLPFTIGIVCFDILAIESQIDFYTAMAVVFICCVWVSVTGNHQLKAVLIFIAWGSSGFAVAFNANVKNDPDWFGNTLKTAGAFSVKITETPQEKERTWKLEVEVQQAIFNDSIKKVNGKAFLYIYKNDSTLAYDMGDILLVPPGWQSLRNPGNPHEFDYATFCRRNNIYYQQFLGKNELIKIPAARKSNLSLAEQTHEWAMKKLEWHVKNKSTLGLLQAMLLGDEVNFNEEDRQLYVDTGIIHVVAISGGHIGFLMMLINASLFWIKKRKHQWIKLLVALPVVVFYVMVAGAPPSAVRAAFVFGLLAFSVFIHRDNSPLNTLLAAALLILLVKPMWLFAVGFQLSFIAVLSLIIFYKRIYGLYYAPAKAVKFLWSAAAASIAAEILVAPLVIYYFHLLPALFLAANVVAVLLMSIVMTLGLAIIAVASFPPVAHILSALASFIVGWFHNLIHYLRAFNPEAFKYLHLSLVELALSYLCIGALTVFILKKSKPAIYTALTGLCLLFLSFNIKKWKALHQEQIVIYNVSRHAYTEYIYGNQFWVISERKDCSVQKKIDYAARESHVAKSAWRENMKEKPPDIFCFGNRKILFLKAPMTYDSSKFHPVDFLVVTYPLKKFNARQLLYTFDFKKLIVTGNQRRKVVEAWKDSCAQYGIDVHFTMMNGAYVIAGNEK